jgi:hypothetical protein
MKSRDERIAEEAAALWRELFGAAPPPADGPSMLKVITGRLPDVRYDRLRSPFLRPSMIARPRSRGKPPEV